MSDKIKKLIVIFSILLFSIAFDQGTKFWAESNFASMRYPDHQIEVQVPPEQAGTTLEQFVKTNYPSLNDNDSHFVMTSASKSGIRISPSDTLEANDTISFNQMTRTVIDGYFDFQYARNPGAAWSFMADKSPEVRKWFFGITGIIAVLLMSIFLFISKWQKNKCLIISLACVLGGALGNIIDRFRLSYVIDFISWHVGNHYWPTFNIADAFVTGGVAFLIIDMFVTSAKEKKAKALEDKSEDNKSEDNKSEDSKSEDSKSEDNKEDNKSEDNKSEDKKEEDNKSEDNKQE